jgi:hydroxymethylpyrimidine/phosphomethylpyrimidine kinase
MQGRVLIVAGSDSGGGAGIQADIKSVTALGGYAATAITALTAQDTRDVHDILDIPPAFIARQMAVVLDDIGADCVKTGMLHNEETIAAVAEVLETRAADTPLVVDPVMYAKGGAELLRPSAREVLKARLIPRATVLTPNLPEAESLSGAKIESAGQMAEVATMMLALGPRAVLLKGGHLEGDTVRDVLAGEGGVQVFESPRVASTSTHGTGCTLASAIATGLAQGLGIPEAVARARAYVLEAIRTAPGLGSGHGPLNHGHTVRDFPG